MLIVCHQLKSNNLNKNFFKLFLAPSLHLEIKSNNFNSSDEVFYGNDSSYDIIVLTIPRSKIVLEITRNGVSLLNDKRFKLILL